MDNIFFDLQKLKKCGKNVIIGKTVRIRYPELVEIGDNCIIDDFCYISTALKIGSYCHISSNCSLVGGQETYIEFGNFSTIAPGVILVAGSDDYKSGLNSVSIPKKFRGNLVLGKLIIGNHCIVGPNSTVLTNLKINDGATVGANSFVKKDLEAWTIYAGIPVRPVGLRNKEEILQLEQDFLKSNND